MSTCHNNPKNSWTPSGYSLFMHATFYTTKNKLDYYRGKDCMKILKILKNFVNIKKKTCNKNNKFWKKNDTINS